MSSKYRSMKIIDKYMEMNIINNDLYRKLIEDQILEDLLSKIKEFDQSRDIAIVIHPINYDDYGLRISREFEVLNLEYESCKVRVPVIEKPSIINDNMILRFKKLMKRKLWRNSNGWKKKK